MADTAKMGGPTCYAPRDPSDSNSALCDRTSPHVGRHAAWVNGRRVYWTEDYPKYDTRKHLGYCAENGCENYSSFWVRRNDASIFVCGKHLPRAVRELRAMTSKNSHPDYGIRDFSDITVTPKDAR